MAASLKNCFPKGIPTENDYPENVEKSVSKADGFMDNFFFERQRAEPRNFKTLNSCRNSHNRYAKENSRQNPFQPKSKSAEKEPEDISQSFHLIQSPFIKNIFAKAFARILYHKIFPEKGSSPNI